MAASEEEGVYFVVNNIPVQFRSADLRNYFSQFIESGGFLCFHYRHRPEVRISRAEAESGQRQKQNRTEEEEEDEDDEYEVEQSSDVKAEASCCCVVSVKRREAARFGKMFSGNQWIDSAGKWMIKRCLIRRIKVSEHSGEASSGLQLPVIPFKGLIWTIYNNQNQNSATQTNLIRPPKSVHLNFLMFFPAPTLAPPPAPPPFLLKSVSRFLFV